MNTATERRRKKIPRRRRTKHPEYYFGPNEQEITRPYRRKTISAQNKLLMYIKLSHLEGNRNMIICPKLHSDDKLKEKWIKILLKMKGNTPELRLHPMKYPYRYRSIVQTTSRDRRCRQDSQRKQKGINKNNRKNMQRTTR